MTSYNHGQLTWQIPQKVTLPPGPSNGSFNNASDFTIQNMNMIEFSELDNSTVLRYLSDRAKKCVPGAMLDSAEREYPPRCNPDTRRQLRNRIVTWGIIERPEHDWRMLWLSGPAGVGKSAVAQTVAEKFQSCGRLGAAFFFSRPNHLDDPDTLIPTIVYQLAVTHSQYKRILLQRLADDPLILDKNRRTQFRELIMEPFHILATQHEDTVRNPLLIVIDGLDECCNRAAQREFIELIGRFTRQVPKLPLLWMISSRPESHLKVVFSDPDTLITCNHERLSIDDKEARYDTWRLLRSGFTKIQKNYADQLDPDWPRYKDEETIATIASGHLGFVSFILRFIEDEQLSDPAGQLRVCISFLKQLPSTHGPVNPLHALDLLYNQILSGVPEKDLSTAMRIVGMLILYPTQRSLPAQNHANFLELDQATFYRSLQYLHSVLDIPPAQKAFEEPIRLYHTSFSDFLMNPSRSGRFCLDRGSVHLDVAIRSLRWQNHAIRAARDVRSYTRLEWVRKQDDRSSVLCSLNGYSAAVGWSACNSIREESVPVLIKQLEGFEFNGLQKVPRDFGFFLRWLYCLSPPYNSLIRVVMCSPASLNADQTPLSCDSTSTGSTLSIEHIIPDIGAYLDAFGLDGGDPSSSIPKVLKLELGNGPLTLHIALSLRQVTSWTPYSPTRSLSTPSISLVRFEDTPLPKRSPSFGRRKTVTEGEMNNVDSQPSISQQGISPDNEPPSLLFASESSTEPAPLLLLEDHDLFADSSHTAESPNIPVFD